MPSRSALAFHDARNRARLLISAASFPPERAFAKDHKEACLHAAWAMLVAAWEAYLERVVGEVHQAISEPSGANYSAVLSLLRAIAESDLKKFNTPNSDNSRRLLVAFTGYDPINDWNFPKLGLGGPQTRTRLDEVLRVRHSFAHGASIPIDINWINSRGFRGVLNVRVVREVDGFISYLVSATEVGLKKHLASVFGVSVSW